MTTLEHALLGTGLVLASGLHRRFGWQLAAVAGVAAVLPDWDGATFLVSIKLFDETHRCWGHGVVPCLLLALLVAWVDCRFDLMTRVARHILYYRHFVFPRFLPGCLREPGALEPHRAEKPSATGIKITRTTIPEEAMRLRPRPSTGTYLVWLAVVFAAMLSHLGADMIVSGGRGLNDWEIKILYPFSDRGFVYPLVPWGDVGILVLFFAGMFAMLRWKDRVQSIALATLLLAAGYALVF